MDDLLLYKFLQNETSDEEVREVLEWLDADPANQRYFDGLDRALNIVRLNLPARRPAMRRGIAWRRVGRWAAGVAAVLGLCLGVSYFAAMRMFDHRARSMTSLFVPNGERICLTLGDGSTVWLNSGTTLEYPALFARDERRVKVSGEAMFDVQPDPDRPFIVETFACDVEVLGTKFNVEADREAGRFSTDLLRGRVRVYNRLDRSDVLTMLPDQRVSLEQGRLLLTTQENADRLLWPDGILCITGMTFGEVMEKFERCYDVAVEIERDELPQIRFQRCKLRVSDGLDHALSVLQQAADFRYERDPERNTVRIR